MMKRQDTKSEKSDSTANEKRELRKRAEDLSKGREKSVPEDLELMTLEEIEQIVHELLVHQIELELQNEELRRAQLEVDRVRARYFDLYDMAPVGYCTISETGEILESNFTLSTLLGRTRGTLKGKLISNFIYSEDQDIYYLISKQLFEIREPQECELRMVKEDGTLFWAHMVDTVVQNEDGKPVFRVTVNDITERKNDENKIRISEEKYRTIAENISDVISVYNIKNDKFTYISPSVFQFRGFTAEEAMKEGLEEKLTPETLVIERKNAGRCLNEFLRDPENPKNYISEIQQFCKNGDIIWVELSKKLRFNADGEVEVVSVSRNITERIIAFADAYDEMINHKTFQKH
ncbi:PAS domain-containing protein [Acetobacterium sp.]|uniref:PAS domain-containing protein n=1 Tax=Acetobacterium sp. TaxID=1872094 RepID=UPI002F3F8C6C